MNNTAARWAGLVVLLAVTGLFVWATPQVSRFLVACAWAAWGLAVPVVVRPLVRRTHE